MEYKFSDIVDVLAVQELMDSLWKAAGIPVRIIDIDGKIQVATGWQEICALYHRKHPETEALCRESDSCLHEHLNAHRKLPESGFVEYHCKNGMIDIAVPIVIEGQYLATLFLGQFFYEAPDEEFFRQHARRYGFDEEKYLAALRKVPTFSRQKVENILDYHTRFVRLLAQMGVQKLKQLEATKRLEESEKRFRGLFENSPVSIWEEDFSQVKTYLDSLKEKGVTDLEGFFEQHPEEVAACAKTVKVLDVNQASLELHEAESKEELLGNLDKTFTDRSLNAFKKQLIAIGAGKTTVQVEGEVKPLAGEPRNVTVRWAVSPGHENTLSRTMVSVSDITKRKQTELALKESQQRLQDILDNAEALVYMKDPEGRMLFINKHFDRLFDLSKEDVLGKTGLELFPSDLAKRYRQNDLLVLEKNTTLRFEETVAEKDGLHTYLSIKFPLRDLTGKVYALCGFSADIMDRKQMEEVLKGALAETEKAREQVDAILKSTADGLIFTDMGNRIILLNPSAEAILGLRFQEILGQSIEDKSLKGHLEAIQAGVKSEAMTELALTGRPKGEVRFIQAKSSIVTDKNNLKAGIITTLRDITRERELDLMKSEFISTAAHELRTPLTSVRGFSELLLYEKGLNAEQQKEFLSIIHEKSGVLENIIEDMLTLSRVESGRVIHLEKKRCDIGLIITRAITQYQKEHKNCHFDMTLPKETINVLADKGKIGQVLENLLSNAVKFSPEKSLIQVTCKKMDSSAQVAIRDEGIGMTPEQAEKIFDKFYRVDSSDTAAPGLGLGMAIVKNIIEAHEGKIWVESALGKGTTVTFSLPVKEEE